MEKQNQQITQLYLALTHKLYIVKALYAETSKLYNIPNL